MVTHIPTGLLLVPGKWPALDAIDHMNRCGVFNHDNDHNINSDDDKYYHIDDEDGDDDN